MFGRGWGKLEGRNGFNQDVLSRYMEFFFSENKLTNISGASEKLIQYTVQVAIVSPLNVSAVMASWFSAVLFPF